MKVYMKYALYVQKKFITLVWQGKLTFSGVPGVRLIPPKVKFWELVQQMCKIMEKTMYNLYKNY